MLMGKDQRGSVLPMTLVLLSCVLLYALTILPLLIHHQDRIQHRLEKEESRYMAESGWKMAMHTLIRIPQDETDWEHRPEQMMGCMDRINAENGEIGTCTILCTPQIFPSDRETQTLVITATGKSGSAKSVCRGTVYIQVERVAEQITEEETVDEDTESYRIVTITAMHDGLEWN